MARYRIGAGLTGSRAGCRLHRGCAFSDGKPVFRRGTRRVPPAAFPTFNGYCSRGALIIPPRPVPAEATPLQDQHLRGSPAEGDASPRAEGIGGSPERDPRSSYVWGLDLIRFSAAVMVVFFHPQLEIA